MQSKGFNSKISSVEVQCANHYTMEPSVTAKIFKCIITFVEFTELIDSAS